MKYKLIHHVVLCTVCAFMPATHAFAQSVSGAFTVDGHAVTPSEVAAFRARDSNDPRNYHTLVVLTGAALDSDTITVSMDPYTTAIHDPAAQGKDYVVFFVAADGKVSFSARAKGIPFVDSSGLVMRQPGNLRADCPVNQVQRVECRIWVEKEVNTAEGESWSLDMRFTTDVRSRTLGAPVPEGGGEAGAALLDLV